MLKKALQVCLVAPLPPPYGGIAHWTRMVSKYAENEKECNLKVVDTAVRWRTVGDLAPWKRILGGIAQLSRDWFRVFLLLRKHPDVLHLTTAGEFGIIRDLLISVTARYYDVPVIYHIRFGRLPTMAKEITLEYRLISRAIKLANTVIAIDAATAAAIRLHLPGKRFVHVPNCFDFKCFPMQNSKETEWQTVVFLGWVIPTKGIEELLQAWSELRPSGWRLWLIGPYVVEYREKLVAKYPVENISFLGEKPHDKALELLANADIFVLPSYTEGFPNSVLEAMAMGKAIVGTRVGAIPEMLEGGGGFLIEPKDVAGLKRALSTIMSDSDLRICMGQRARLRAIGTYSIETVFRQYTKVWCEASMGKNAAKRTRIIMQLSDK